MIMLTLQEFKILHKMFIQEDSANPPPVEFYWCFRLKAPRDIVWSFLSDTSRMNRELGLSSRDQAEVDGQISVSTQLLGFKQEWIEEPWTWISGQTIANSRRYICGIAKHMCGVFHLAEDSVQDSRLVYVYFAWKPSNVFWALVLRFSASHMKRQFTRYFAKFDFQGEKKNSIGIEINQPGQISSPHFARGGEARLKLLRKQLVEKSQCVSIVDRLCELVLHGDDMDLESIRVMALAAQWGSDFRDVLVICLLATKIGLLKISWKVICPHCRGSRFSADSLGDIPESAECHVCEIDFVTNGPESIEVVFHVHSSIRLVEEQLYCAAEPDKKRHIKAQLLLESGQEVDLNTALNDGTYRLRWVGQKNSQTIQISSANQQNELDAFQNISCEEPLVVGSPLIVHIKNSDPHAGIFVLEELWWDKQILRPGHVFAIAEFRDLFGKEHLSSNVRLSLGEQAVLFTDIVGSTAFYNSVGDAKAFAEVRSHFQEVFEEVRGHHGAVVKTIGDAVMASYGSIEDAMKSAVSIQERFHAGRTDTQIRLRISIHAGPVIAVHLNTGLDYFGRTINFAAKIQSCANAGEIAMSGEMYRKLTEIFAVDSKYQIIRNKKVLGGMVDDADIYVMKVAREELSKVSWVLRN